MIELYVSRELGRLLWSIPSCITLLTCTRLPAGRGQQRPAQLPPQGPPAFHNPGGTSQPPLGVMAGGLGSLAGQVPRSGAQFQGTGAQFTMIPAASPPRGVTSPGPQATFLRMSSPPASPLAATSASTPAGPVSGPQPIVPPLPRTTTLSTHFGGFASPQPQAPTGAVPAGGLGVFNAGAGMHLPVPTGSPGGAVAPGGATPGAVKKDGTGRGRGRGRKRDLSTATGTDAQVGSSLWGRFQRFSPPTNPFFLSCCLPSLSQIYLTLYVFLYPRSFLLFLFVLPCRSRKLPNFFCLCPSGAGHYSLTPY